MENGLWNYIHKLTTNWVTSTCYQRNDPFADPVESSVKAVTVTVILTHLLTCLLTVHEDSGFPFPPSNVTLSFSPSRESLYYCSLGEVEFCSNGSHTELFFGRFCLVGFPKGLGLLNELLLPLLVPLVFV